MRCYTWEEGVLTEGIIVKEIVDERAVYLGKHSRYWSHKSVGIHPYNPPEVYETEESGEEFITDAFPVTRKYSTSSGVRFVLAKPDPKHEGDERTLVAVSTHSGEGDEDNRGFWRTVQGDVEHIASGVIVSEENQWQKGLFRLGEGDVMRISMTDPFKEDHALYLEDGELHTCSWPDYTR